MAVFVILMKWVVPDFWSPVVNLGVQVLGGGVVYILAIFLLFRTRAEAFIRFARNGLN
jgi:hypothetical protein